MNKKILVAFTIAVILGTMTLPALAKPPDHFSEIFDEPPLFIADCGDFEVLTQGSTLYLDGTVHYDKEGNPTKIITHYWAEDVYWSPETGKEVPMETNLLTSLEDLESGEIRSAGIQFRLTIPGEGTILMDVGRLVFDYPDITFEAGQHPVYFPEEGDFEKLCAWFAE